jgi:histidinol-phosphatase
VPVLTDDLSLALELADAADEITLARYGAVDLAVSTKPDMTPVTEADTAAEQAIRGRLTDTRPGDVVFGEEYGSQGAESARRWIVDPIDGTKNYVRRIPVWATLLALEEDGECTVGVVSAPALGRRWWAARGQGAFGSEFGSSPRAVRVSSVAALEDAQLTLAGQKELLAGSRRDGVLALIERCWRTRGFGDFWAYMLVAEGALEIAVDAPGVSLWDLAAPLVIVEEAGGRFSDFDGQRTAGAGEGMATNGLLHDQVLELLAGGA